MFSGLVLGIPTIISVRVTLVPLAESDVGDFPFVYSKAMEFCAALVLCSRAARQLPLCMGIPALTER